MQRTFCFQNKLITCAVYHTVVDLLSISSLKVKFPTCDRVKQKFIVLFLQRLEVRKNACTFRKCYSTFRKLSSGYFCKEKFWVGTQIIEYLMGTHFLNFMMSFLGALFSLVRAGRFPFLFSFLNLVGCFHEESRFFSLEVYCQKEYVLMIRFVIVLTTRTNILLRITKLDPNMKQIYSFGV